MKKKALFLSGSSRRILQQSKVPSSRFSPKWDYKVASLAKHFLIANSPKYPIPGRKLQSSTITGSSFTADALDVGTNITETK
jgi:hypothetical protein